MFSLTNSEQTKEKKQQISKELTKKFHITFPSIVRIVVKKSKFNRFENFVKKSNNFVLIRLYINYTKILFIK